MLKTFIKTKRYFTPFFYYFGSLLFCISLYILYTNQLEEEIVIDPKILSPCDTNQAIKNNAWSAPPWSGYNGPVNYSVKISYTSSKDYKGPVIRGWEPERDRNITNYLKPTENNILLDPLACKSTQDEPLEMVIMQHSAPNNFEIRMANRVSWMRFAESMPEIRLLFVIGVPTVSQDDLEHIDYQVQTEIKEEYSKFGDILQVDSYESYSNNTLKSLHSIKYLLGVDWARISKSGKPPRFLMRTDDDVFINLPLVRKLILQDKKWTSQEGKPQWPPMLGSLLTNSVVVKIPKEKLEEKYAPKTWYECPTYFHDGEGLYPSYMQGAGYFIPWWMLTCIYQQSLQLPYFFIEDVFIGGWAGERCFLPKQRLDGFTMFRPNKPILLLDPKNDILIHYVDKTYKIRAYRFLKSIDETTL